jgi:hypothetical protein
MHGNQNRWIAREYKRGYFHKSRFKKKKKKLIVIDSCGTKRKKN